MIRAVTRTGGPAAAATRARLAEAAAEVFARDGFEAAKVSAIAQAASLTTGAIYFHYADKATLLTESLSQHGGSELARLLEGASPGTLPELMRSVGRLLGDDRDEDGSLFTEAVVAARRQPGVAEVLRGHLEEREASLVALGQEAQATGQLDPTLPIEATVRFWVLLRLGALLVRALELEPPATDDWEAVIDRVVAALTGEEGA
jgi:TetR/AcrR family acrAB operon transcriptional repressor